MNEELAKIEADRLLELLLKHQPGLLKPGGLAAADADNIAQFIAFLRAALLRTSLSRD